MEEEEAEEYKRLLQPQKKQSQPQPPVSTKATGEISSIDQKAMESVSTAVYLKHRCSKAKRVILAFLNRAIVIYEVSFSGEDKSKTTVAMLSRLELQELYDLEMGSA